MNWRTLTVVALAAFLGLPATALASHMGQYTFSPTEHDDQGSSNEPDRMTTTVLTSPLELRQRVIDYNRDYTAELDTATPAGKILAPGCTDNAGRQINGQCGLWTIGMSNPTAGVRVFERHTQGVPEGNGPGLTGKGAITVRFLDSRVDADYSIPAVGGSQFIDVNKKLEDRGGYDITGGPIIPPGPVALWVWYGTWSDGNGNGVIDHLGFDQEEGGALYPDNEFVWGGECTAFDGTPSPPEGYIWCQPDPANSNPKVFLYVYPGNSHAYCGGYIDPLAATCALVPADFPGRQVVGFVDALLPDALGAGPVAVGSGCTLFFYTDYDNPTGCQDDLRRADYNDDSAWGDPLLGPAGTVKPDGKFHDRAGDSVTNVRHIVYGDGWATYFYDQSLLTSTTAVTVVGCPSDPGSPNALILGLCRFVDIDRYNAINPLLDDLVQGTVKPAARDGWVLARDGLTPVQATVGSLTQMKAVYDATQGPAQGNLDDQVNDPGFAREPNQGAVSFVPITTQHGNQDAFPGSVRGSCANPDATFKGWCNSYAGNTAPHAWADLLASRIALYGVPISATPGGQCLQCVAGATVAIPFAGEPIDGVFPRAPGTHDRSLGPGIYNWLGFLGVWQDRPQTWTEFFFDLATLSPVSKEYTKPRDGWVGNVVNATGTYYYRGYADVSCTTDQGAGVKTFGACNPYLDGNLANPQQAGQADHTEWLQKRCDTTVSGPNIRILLYPAGGVWTVPVYRWVNHANGFALLDPATVTPLSGLTLEERTGSTGPIEILGGCSASGETGFFAGNDLLVLPQGNQGLDVASVLVTTAALDEVNNVREKVVDVDLYQGWSL